MVVERPTDLIHRHEGAECIYKEGKYICHARVRSIKADDWGINAELVPIPSQGLIAPTEPWESGTIWECFSCHAESWTCASSGLVWRVFFDKALIREVKELGRTFSDEESESDRRMSLVKCISACEIRRIKNRLPPSSA